MADFKETVPNLGHLFQLNEPEWDLLLQARAGGSNNGFWPVLMIFEIRRVVVKEQDVPLLLQIIKNSKSTTA